MYPLLFLLSPISIYIDYVPTLKEDTCILTANQRKMCMFARSIFGATPFYIQTIFKLFRKPEKFNLLNQIEEQDTLLECGSILNTIIFVCVGWGPVVSPFIEKYWNRDFF